jgi:hypothetical protein
VPEDRYKPVVVAFAAGNARAGTAAARNSSGVEEALMTRICSQCCPVVLAYLRISSSTRGLNRNIYQSRTWQHGQSPSDRLPEYMFWQVFTASTMHIATAVMRCPAEGWTSGVDRFESLSTKRHSDSVASSNQSADPDKSGVE